MGVIQLNTGLYLQQNNRKKEPPRGRAKEGDTRYFLRERMDMPRAATAMRAAAAATISLAPVVGFFWSSVLGVSAGVVSPGTMMVMLVGSV